MHGHGSVSRLTSGTNGDFSVEQMDASVDRCHLDAKIQVARSRARVLRQQHRTQPPAEVLWNFTGGKLRGGSPARE